MRKTRAFQFYASTTLSLNAPWFLFVRQSRQDGNYEVAFTMKRFYKVKKSCGRRGKSKLCCFVSVLEKNLSSATMAKAFMRKDSLRGCSWVMSKNSSGKEMLEREIWMETLSDHPQCSRLFNRDCIFLHRPSQVIWDNESQQWNGLNGLQEKHIRAI